MEIKKIREIEDISGMTYRNYTVYGYGCYTASETEYADGSKNIVVQLSPSGREEFLPEIVCDGWRTGKQEFKVQTVAYGALSTSDLSEIIKQLNIGIQIADALNEYFFQVENRRIEHETDNIRRAGKVSQ